MTPIYSRRQALKATSAGFGYVALAGLLGQQSRAADLAKPLAPKAPHFKPRAKRVIFVFLQGAISQMDTIEYKPQLQKFYYDPTKFKTYLEQLGIEYPTVRPAESKPRGDN